MEMLNLCIASFKGNVEKHIKTASKRRQEGSEKAEEKQAQGWDALIDELAAILEDAEHHLHEAGA